MNEHVRFQMALRDGGIRTEVALEAFLALVSLLVDLELKKTKSEFVSESSLAPMQAKKSMLGHFYR